MIAKSPEDFFGLNEIGKICAEIRDVLVSNTKVGITTAELDEIAKSMFEKAGAISAPKNEYNFPGYTCISVGHEIAHGIPGKRVIQEGDLVNVDVSGSKNGYFADTGISFVVGKGDPILHKVCEVSKESLYKALKHIGPGSPKNILGKIVHETARTHGLTVIKNLTGHGIGRSIHEEPTHIFNFFSNWENELLEDGMVIAFEPMISTSEEEVFLADDGWTLLTERSHVAQFEHTVIITKQGPIITTL